MTSHDAIRVELPDAATAQLLLDVATLGMAVARGASDPAQRQFHSTRAAVMLSAVLDTPPGVPAKLAPIMLALYERVQAAQAPARERGA